MARIRTIKPAAFTSDELYDLEHETGLPIRWAFAGLWTVSDRRGRFEWRPRVLKLGVLPHDECDFSRVLDALTTRGFVVKYACDGREYGWIPGFKRHQIVNNREEESHLPPHSEDPDQSTTWTRAPRVDDACLTPLVQDQGEGKGREQEQEGNGKGTGRSTPADADASPATLTRWLADLCPSLPRVQSWTDTRKRTLRARWREHPDLGWWTEFLSRIEASDFLTGRCPPRDGHASFKADLFWCLKPDNLAKIIEGRYDNRPTTSMLGAGKTAGNAAALDAYLETLHVDGR